MLKTRPARELARTLVRANLSVLNVFFVTNLAPIDGKSCMLYARHLARSVTRFKQVFRRDRKGYLRAVSCAAVPTMASNLVELHR